MAEQNTRTQESNNTHLEHSAEHLRSAELNVRERAVGP